MENKNNMTVHQRNFNMRFGMYLQKLIKSNEPINIYSIMLRANELYAYSYGHYPDRDEDWIKELCYELLKIVEDYAWMQFDNENKECQTLLAYMSICELDAVRL